MRRAWLPYAGITRIRFEGSSYEFSVLFARPQPIKSYSTGGATVSKMPEFCPRTRNAAVDQSLCSDAGAFARWLPPSDDYSSETKECFQFSMGVVNGDGGRARRWFRAAHGG